MEFKKLIVIGMLACSTVIGLQAAQATQDAQTAAMQQERHPTYKCPLFEYKYRKNIVKWLQNSLKSEGSVELCDEHPGIVLTAGEKAAYSFLTEGILDQQLNKLFKDKIDPIFKLMKQQVKQKQAERAFKKLKEELEKTGIVSLDDMTEHQMVFVSSLVQQGKMGQWAKRMNTEIFEKFVPQINVTEVLERLKADRLEKEAIIVAGEAIESLEARLEEITGRVEELKQQEEEQERLEEQAIQEEERRLVVQRRVSIARNTALVVALATAVRLVQHKGDYRKLGQDIKKMYNFVVDCAKSPRQTLNALQANSALGIEMLRNLKREQAQEFMRKNWFRLWAFLKALRPQGAENALEFNND